MIAATGALDDGHLMASKKKPAKKTNRKAVSRRTSPRPASRATKAPPRRSRTPRLTVVTLGVQDLARARAFYERLGFAVSSASNESIVFMDAGGTVLALYRRKMLADDANMTSEGSGFGGVTLARNVASKADVDAALASAREAGA